MNEFCELYEKYRYDIYLFILRIVNYKKDIAEELTQETFYQTFNSLHKYNGKCEIKTWICAIAKNVCFHYFKKNPILDSFDDENLMKKTDISNETSIEEIVIRQDNYAKVMTQIQGLDKKYRDVILYRIYFELSYKEISYKMNISENSAKVLFYRGKEMLRSRINSI